MSRLSMSIWEQQLRPGDRFGPEDFPGYSTFVHWCPEEGCWIATCPELLEIYGDDARAPGESAAEAVGELGGTIAALTADRLRRGKPLPEERVFRHHSGKLSLRMPSWLHEQIAHEAHRDRTSINAWIVSRLAEAAGRYL